VPFSDKDMVREKMTPEDPFGGTLAVSPDEIVNIGSSGGTTGLPTLIPLTRLDYEIVVRMVSRVFREWYVKPGDVVIWQGLRAQCAYGPIEYATQRYGAKFVMADALPVEMEARRNIVFCRYLKPKAMFCVPTMTRLMERLIREEGYENPKDLFTIDSLCFGGEPLTKVAQKKIKETWGCKNLYDWPSMADSHYLESSCYTNTGGHIHEDFFLHEVIDPETGEPVTESERGERVITHLWTKAVPYVRWRTDDIIDFTDEVCECGRTSRRETVVGRKGWGINVKDKLIMPIEVEEVIRATPETETSEFQIIKYAERMDTLKMICGYETRLVKNLDELKDKLEKSLSSALEVPVEVELLEPEELKKRMGVGWKSIRVADLTKKKK